MADTIPAKLKSLQLAPFVKRAAQLEKFKPIVAYWLNFYIVQRIISGGLHSADEECTAYTTKLMEKLEQTKAENPNEDAILDDTAASAYCEQFALQTFSKAEREMNENRANGTTADTLMAASTFLEILSVWNKEPASDITAKTKFAKYHALRILKAIKAGEDPNLSNPAQKTEEQMISPPPLDPNDPEVQQISQASAQDPQSLQPQNPYQPYVETAPNTSTQPSPSFSAARVSPPPTNFPPVPSGYTQPSHNDVSPISQPASSRNGSVASVGGGYFPRMDAGPPTFTAETTAPALPTAPSMDEDPLTSSLPTSPQASSVPGNDPASFYQNATSSQPPAQSPPPQIPHQSPPPVSFSQPTQGPPATQQPSFQSDVTPTQSQYQYNAPSPQPPQRGAVGAFPPPAQQQSTPNPYTNPYAQQSAPPPQPQQYQQQQYSQGPLRTDEDSIAEAQKHAKWAISALNFEDSATAVNELRIALRALGAN